MKTYGFDYSYAVTIDRINRALIDNLSNIDLSMSYKTVDEDTGSTITLAAKLAPWQIATGGQNSLLNVSIPFSEGVLSLEGGAITGSYDLSGASAVVQIELGWMGPGTPLQGRGQGSLTQLVFDPSETTQNNPGYVATTVILDPDKNLDPVAKGLLKAYMASALISNKGNLQYIFANVNPEPENLASWLRPQSWLYYYTDIGASGGLCFLCMMDGTLPTNPAFDSSALVPGADCALLISQPQFFTHAVLPGVQAAFPGGQFTVSSSDEVSTITNDGDFDVGSLSASSLTVKTTAQGDGLQIAASGGGPLKFLFGLAKLPGASYSWSVDSSNPMTFSGGEVKFTSDPSPVITQDHEIHWYDWVLLATVGITTLPGLVSAIYDMVKNFHDGAMDTGIGNINDNVQKATSGNMVNLQSIVDWRLDGQQLDLTDASLSGALYTYGVFR